jgi:uncharacterized protein (DUF4415 family)
MVGAPAFMRGKECFSAPGTTSTMIMRFSAGAHRLCTWFYSWFMRIERTFMAKKSSAPAERKNMRSNDITNRQWTQKARQVLRRTAERQAAGDESHINFEDIPHLTDEQLANMVRLRDTRAKVAVSVRLDPQVLDWLKSKGEGHLTRINDILTNLMEAERRIESGR